MNRKLASLCLSIIGMFIFVSGAAAETIYQEPSDFVREAFSGLPPEVSILSITGKRREIITEILDHAPPILRTRYWMKGNRSVWILEEIGKTKPITAGFIVEDGHIQDVRILIYRESHGGEIRHDVFTDQFVGAALTDQRNLTKPIDGISGATLSVNAIRRLASLALYLDHEARIPG